MPRRNDIHRILLIGSGPIVIGQGCEFDYSGTQACRALKEEGFEVILVNSNPATIMTDPDLADRTYVEPITIEVVEAILEREHPDALLPTMGGQTALNISVELVKRGILEKHGVQLIGASYESIQKAEDRDLFKQAMKRIGLTVAASGSFRSREEALQLLETIGFPAIVRPSFTLGGAGGNIAYNREEFDKYIDWALVTSPVGQALLEQSLLGWKEYELEVMRDSNDNVVIVCPIENFDPMGVHTGDSITVAPAMTLSDKEYQHMRDAAIRIIREIGVDTGGSNIQFSLNPDNGALMVIEMNPRVSRSSALASKATGFPIAKIAAKLAVGYTLDEIPNDITQVTKACFEPTIDYVVVKIPRFTFEKFDGIDRVLTTHMKSVGEAMALGATFKEALQKAIRSLETNRYGLMSLHGLNGKKDSAGSAHPLYERLQSHVRIPTADRLWFLADAFRIGMSVEELYHLSRVDPWFLHEIEELVEFEAEWVRRSKEEVGNDRPHDSRKGCPDSLVALLEQAKDYGFSDQRLGQLIGREEDTIRQWRQAWRSGYGTVFKRVDTCGAEFEAHTPYLYSTSGFSCESRPTQKRKIMILGGGPNRIGQGIEFDYCCVHAAMALKEEGIETIMVNCNPETVSTDYDVSDRLYFEPLTKEEVLRIILTERPDGVVVQFGGQTPLKLAVPLEQEGVRILGTQPDAIDRAEDRKRFSDLLIELNLLQPQNGTARSSHEAHIIAVNIGYPVMVRPSYVLGGRAMQIVYDADALDEYLQRHGMDLGRHPLLIDDYLEDAIEVDVDAIADGTDVVVAAIMEHVEMAGIHSGDSACSLPAHSLSADILEAINHQTILLAKELRVAGLMNIQYAVKDGSVYILEVNPRASRTVPFVSKAIGVPLAKHAMKIMAGRTLKDLGFTQCSPFSHIAIKEAVFPFTKLGVADVLLGPEMRSTGEVMGIDRSFGWAFAKSQAASGMPLPLTGTALLSVKDGDKPATLAIAQRLSQLGFSLNATKGTAAFLRTHGIPVVTVNKINEARPHIEDLLKNKELSLVVNTVGGASSQDDSAPIRKASVFGGIPYFTTIQAAQAAIAGIEAMKKTSMEVRCLQEYHSAMPAG
ncbi:MAG: carbamoyl-phosphate synthase large subunit [Nitrospirales bacterium]|nr:carbamoyl-phosphate synthase large subunit [Nitrospirales bacterium]MDR4482496.1 carbamoyl-phosphate synthase large subunit [Nitrospirales bacterium]